MLLHQAKAILLSTGLTNEQLDRYSAKEIRRFAARVPDNKCCFCGETFRGWGNNPSPVLNEEGAVACHQCNQCIVLPQRIRNMSRRGSSCQRS
jgi:hypothetical protein